MRRMPQLLMAWVLVLGLPLLARGEVIITGRVTDSSGRPLPGAVVSVKGTTFRATTDAGGSYRLALPSAPKKLEIEVRFSGFAVLTRTVAANQPTMVVNFKLGKAVPARRQKVERSKPPKANRPPKRAQRRPRPVPRQPERTQPVPTEAPVPAELPSSEPVPDKPAIPIERPSGDVAVPDPTAHSLALVDSILSSLAQASVAFNAPVSLNLKGTATIQLLLDINKSVDQLSQMIQAEGVKQGDRVRVASRMEARLTGPGFEITSITPEEQAVSSLEPTEWKWEITPTQPGRHNLHLTLTALLQVGDATSRRAIRTFDKTIAVEVTLGQRASAFVGENWQWLWAVVLVPVAGWLLRVRKRVSAD